jgi:hypothetical protein
VTSDEPASENSCAVHTSLSQSPIGRPLKAHRHVQER